MDEEGMQMCNGTKKIANTFFLDTEINVKLPKRVARDTRACVLSSNMILVDYNFGTTF
jgi:hypothetical protein